jgi:acetyl-CoA acetyltransferase
MSDSLKDKASIVGIGLTPFSKNSGVSELSLACQAVRAAIDDAGLRPSDVDGLVTFLLDSSDEIEVARSTGIGDMSFFSQINYGGGAAVGLIHQAAMAVATGSAKYVVVYRAMNGRSGKRMGQGVSGHAITSDLVHWSWYRPFGLLTPASWIALQAQRYMHEYGATREHLAVIAITQRAHAQKNRMAATRGRPLTRDEYMSARMISRPLGLYDCCQETDGGAALVVTTLERARDLPNKPAQIRAVSQASFEGQEQMTSFYRPDVAALPEMEMAARIVYEQSGLGPDDIDAACLYDAFTPEVLMQLESFGFCGKGEAKDFIADGALTVGGRLPNNTHGGLLSEAYIHGINNIVEGVRLVRGTSCNQPQNVNHVLVSSGVGVPTGAMILGHAS